jgi:hypothetical protein
VDLAGAQLPDRCPKLSKEGTVKAMAKLFAVGAATPGTLVLSAGVGQAQLVITGNDEKVRFDPPPAPGRRGLCPAAGRARAPGAAPLRPVLEAVACPTLVATGQSTVTFSRGESVPKWGELRRNRGGETHERNPRPEAYQHRARSCPELKCISRRRYRRAIPCRCRRPRNPN